MSAEDNPGAWRCYDRDNHPITQPEWERLRAIVFRQIARTCLTDTDAPADEWTVSTLWRQPTSYETVVVLGGTVIESGRYTNIGAARIGHADVVAALAASMAAPLIVHPVPRAHSDDRTEAQ